MPFRIVRDNIVHMRVDAIVNAANTELQMGGGVCGSIFSKAGADELARACAAIGHCGVGEAVITPGFSLPARYIIHTVGPVWRGGLMDESRRLASCYTNSLCLARERELASVAFPLISSGIYGYPKDKALSVAVGAIGEFLLQNDMTVYLVVYDRDSYRLSTKLMESVESYIDEHYVSEREQYARLNRMAQSDYTAGFGSDEPLDECASEPPMPTASALWVDALIKGRSFAVRQKPGGVFPRSLQNRVEHLSDSFSESVLHIIDERGEKDADVYKRANLDRKLFSKLRGDSAYQPSKQTAVALALALRLNIDDTRDLLARAGYALSPSRRGDVIVSYFISKGNYNIFELNEVLFAFDEPCL